MTGPSVEDELIIEAGRLAREKTAALAEVDRLTTALADMTREARLSRESTEKAVRRAERAEADLRVLREGIKGLAATYHLYETDVWADDVAHNLRALLGESS